MILSVAVVKGFKSEIRDKMRGFSGDIIAMKYDLNNSYENSPFAISKDTLLKISQLPGVAHIQPYAIKTGIINTNEEVEGVILKGVDKTYDWTYFKRVLVAGKVIDYTDSVKSRKQIIISRFLANRLKVKLGDDFLMYFVQQSLLKRKFKIVGIYDLGVEEVDKTYIIGDLSEIRRLNKWKKDEVGGFELRVNDFDKLDKINNDVGGFMSYNVRTYTIKEWYQTIFQWLSLLDVNTEVILILMMAVAVINMISALMIIILERTNMIGILKALGSTNWQVQKIFLNNAAFLIGFGLLLGNLVGIGLGLFQNLTHFFELDQSSYYMQFVPVEFSIADILILNVSTLAVCLVVLLIPSMLVTRISPVKTISFK
ncbi:ABC transporter permease [Desertivirga arenae]|uniref:ABC transporter permease n=1 Tax=Desertivirga arenae TaxID=2810309 RepID=UPI00350F6C52